MTDVLIELKHHWLFFLNRPFNFSTHPEGEPSTYVRPGRLHEYVGGIRVMCACGRVHSLHNDTYTTTPENQMSVRP